VSEPEFIAFLSDPESIRSHDFIEKLDQDPELEFNFMNTSVLFCGLLNKSFQLAELLKSNRS